MVRLQEIDPNNPVSDSEFTDYSTDEDAASEISSTEESLADRIAALVDIIPPTTRHKITTTVSSVTNGTMWTAKLMGKIAWVVSTSALLVVLPLALEIEKEQGIVAFENEQKMREQGAQQMLLQPGQLGQQPQKPTSVVPPGF